MAETVAVQARVVGRVQGVGFRFHTEVEARRLGVAGWVRNEPDGRVLVHAEGEPAAVDALVAWLHDGPPSARVERVGTTTAALSGATSFDVRF